MEKYHFTNEERAAYESIKVPFAIYQFINKRVVALILSDGFCDLFGYDDRSAAYHDMNNDMYKDAHPDDAARIADAAQRFAAEGGSYEVVYRTKKRNSSEYIVIHAKGEHIYKEDGTRLAEVWYTGEGIYTEDLTVTDTSLSRTLSKALHEQSYLRATQYDYLTGLPNMMHFFDLADAGAGLFAENVSDYVIMYMDFGGMKFFNANHGFAEGDRMLRSFAHLLSDEFGNENCCRIGADHFAAIAAEEGLEKRLGHLIARTGALYSGKMPPLHIGIYPKRLGDVSISTACDRAKSACRYISGSYTSGFNYYSEELQKESEQRQYIIENIDKAISEKWIQVYYQPIIRSVDEKICDEEALARWIDPVKGFMSPAAFIPALEDSGLIYKLDLYVLEQVLDHIKILESEGFYIVPRSINLSRSDFDTCDIVEEIRSRVDAAGVAHDRITIEITESIIGSDFDFIKEQIIRFQNLGFPVWMDDFGSAYSSLDVLQSVSFDLLKFDMSFMKKLDEGGNGKIILTELMRMATALGLETVCEGVETEAQVKFLRDIGCSKMQGFYFAKPESFEKIMEWNRKTNGHTIENPEEADYYESMGRLNLYDLGAVALDEDNSFHNTFDTMPVGIVEVSGDHTRFVRSNQSYRDFIKRYFGFELSELGSAYAKYDIAFMHNIVEKCCEQGHRSLYNEKMPDGTVVHSFARRISVNPVNGNTSVAIAVLSITDPDEATTYADIARALASDYHNIYIVDLDTDDYIEYTSQIGAEELAMERHGTDFFEDARRDTMTRIYEKDRDAFLSVFYKENLINVLDKHGVFTTTYRLIETGEPMYASMKVTRMQYGGNSIIIGVSIIDSYMKEREHFEELQKERDAMARVMALSDGYLSLFTVEPETGHYVEFSSSDAFDSLGAAKEGSDFFGQSSIDAEKYFYEDDKKRFISQFTLENVMKDIREKGVYEIRYHLMIDNKPKPVKLKAALFSDGKEEKLAVGIRAIETMDQAEQA